MRLVQWLARKIKSLGTSSERDLQDHHLFVEYVRMKGRPRDVRQFERLGDADERAHAIVNAGRFEVPVELIAEMLASEGELGRAALIAAAEGHAPAPAYPYPNVASATPALGARR